MNKLIFTVFTAAFVASPTGVVSSQVVRDTVQELQSVDVIEHAGELIPPELTFIDDQGRTVTLADYFNQGKPVLLVLGYYRCPMLCNLVFNGIVDGVRGLEWLPGEEFQILTISIDPAETFDLAAAKKKNYIENLGIPEAAVGWSFLVGEQHQIQAIADAVGFSYHYVEERNEYAHPAVIYLLTEEGRISRYLYGIQFNPRDLRLGLLEASDGKIGDSFDRILLYCYHYDPDAGGYVVFAQNVMTLSGVATVGILAVFLGALWFREHRRNNRRVVYTPKSSLGNSSQ